MLLLFLYKNRSALANPVPKLEPNNQEPLQIRTQPQRNMVTDDSCILFIHQERTQIGRNFILLSEQVSEDWSKPFNQEPWEKGPRTPTNQWGRPMSTVTSRVTLNPNLQSQSVPPLATMCPSKLPSTHLSSSYTQCGTELVFLMDTSYLLP